MLLKRLARNWVLVKQHTIPSGREKAKYGRMEVNDVAKMKMMESELSEYKEIVAELSLENRAM